MANLGYHALPALCIIGMFGGLYFGEEHGKKEAAPVHICRVDLDKDGNPDYVVEQRDGTKTGFLAELSGTVRQLTEREQKDSSLAELVSSCK